ncbi:RNA polymerase sigma factor [Candidatus Aerophobetes bacterium]|nr:RNA polymerase sigma factor [Candidatus Aerophobetes bacterium]
MRQKDEDLVQKVKEGNVRAFDELYARYLDPIYRYIYSKLFHHQDTEDICQEVFIKVFRHIRHFRSEGCFVSWLYVIAKNETLRHLKRRNLKKSLRFFPLEKEKDFAPEIACESIFKPDYLEEALNRLSSYQREVVLLHGLKEMPISYVSSILGKSKKATKSAYYRALKNLRNYFRQKEVKIEQKA